MHKKSKFHYYQIFPVKTAFKIKKNTTIFWLSSPSALSCFLAGHVTSLGGFRLGSPPPGAFIAGRSKAALLFWFFRDFGCGVLLFIFGLVMCGCGDG